MLSLRHAALTLLTAAFLSVPVAASDRADKEECRIAFDMGSSGIRAGASSSKAGARRDLDAIGPLWAGQGVAAIEAAVTAALLELPQEGRLPMNCRRVGGGFSAWRLATEQDRSALASALRRIHASTGVAVLVIPPDTEGSYAYFAAKRELGSHFTTTHVLDLGGGSLQVAGEKQSFAAALGQKAWHRVLCERLRDTTQVPCTLQPMDERDLTRARALIAVRLAGHELPAETTMTAISRPVTRGVQPAVQRLAGQVVERTRPLQRAPLQAAIAQLTALDLPTTVTRTGTAPGHAAFLLSDMILVEGLMQLTTDHRLQVAEIDIDNIPGLLADERAFAWQRRYDCYLERLESLGIAAYLTDSGTCRSDDIR